MARAWRYLKENLDTILTIATGAVVAVLGLLNIVGAGVISAVTLAILSLIAFSLLRNRATNDQLQQTIQETRSQLQATLAGMQKRRTSEILFPWGTQTNERNRHFSQAKEVWILSRTCRRLWADNKIHLENVARRGRVRLLFINPDSYALNMIVQTNTFAKMAVSRI